MNTARNYQKELDKIIDRITGKTTGGRTDGADEKTTRPIKLFLHSCCAPCSSYVLEYLRAYFQITVFYYNPNISWESEYRKRVEEQKRLIAAYNAEAGKCDCKKESRLEADCSVENRSGADYSVENRSGMDYSVENNSEGVDSAGRRPEIYPIEILEGDYDPERFFGIAKGLEQCPEGGERCFACYELRLRRTAELASAGGYDYFATTLTISPLKNAAKLNEIGERLAGEYGVDWLPSDFKKRGGYQRSIVLSKEYDLYRQDYCGCIYSREQQGR